MIVSRSTQPIAPRDVPRHLVNCLKVEEKPSQTRGIAGPDVVTDREMMCVGWVDASGSFWRSRF